MAKVTRTKQRNIRIEPELDAKLEELANRSGKTASELLRDLIILAVKRCPLCNQDID